MTGISIDVWWWWVQNGEGANLYVNRTYGMLLTLRRHTIIRINKLVFSILFARRLVENQGITGAEDLKNNNNSAE